MFGVSEFTNRDAREENRKDVIAVALSLWGAMSAGAVVAGSLSCLVSIPLYYVLERKLVKG